MAAPFIQVPIPAGSRHHPDNCGGGNKLTDEEACHLLLMAYPGYTIRLIETELSRRQIEVMMAAWEDNPPAFVTLKRLQIMFGKVHGFRRQKTGERLSGQAMVDSLISRGYL